MYKKFCCQKRCPPKAVTGAPLSPRNRAIWAMSGQPEKYLITAVFGSSAGFVAEPYSAKRNIEGTGVLYNIGPKPKKAKTHQPHPHRYGESMTVKAITQRIKAVREEATERTSDMTVYNNYKSHLLPSEIYCRILNDLEATYALPDINECTGQFKASKFVHTTRKMLQPNTADGSTLQPKYGCTCAIYHTLVKRNAADKINQGRTYNLCVHTRLLHDYLPELGKEWSDNAISQKLKDVGSQSNLPVVIVHENTERIKYSVVVNSEVSFVHISTNPATGRKVVRCKVRCNSTLISSNL